MARARQHAGLLGVETATLANTSAGQANFTGDAAPKPTLNHTALPSWFTDKSMTVTAYFLWLAPYA
jgi:hypothetical protein